MIKVLKTIITITIILTNIGLSAGQVITGLPFNHGILNAIEEGDKSYQKSVVEIIEFDTLFFDDFSDYHYSVFPRNNHWADRYAYINSTYPDSMISLGAATLDAFDQRGYPYYSLDHSGGVPSDTLTSQPFRFLNMPDQKVFFSFFYQPGGKGDPPEGIIPDNPDYRGEDTLCLEFYSVTDERWDSIFYTLDSADTRPFKQVILEVDSHYLKNGFQFRFRNYTSLPPDYQMGHDAGMFSNADMWHIDYIQMREAGSASELITLKDITVVNQLLPSLMEYTSVPWDHYTQAQSSEGGLRMNIPFSVRNFDPDDGNPVTFHRYFETRKLSGQLLANRDYENSLPPFGYVTYFDDYTTGLTYSDNDSIGLIETIAYIEPNIGIVQPFVNDTVKRREVYYDQYAYDDGSAEYGIGIGGEFQENTRIAQRYRVFRRSNNPDKLYAVLIYFGKSVDSTTLDYTYSISIRKNDSIGPASEILYTSDTLSPDYSVRMNEFTRIEIDPPLLISDTFFVVVNQIGGFLNIGYDINNDNTDKIFVYTNQTWTRPGSLMKGSMMIRPSFGKYSLPTEIPTNSGSHEQLLIYPNPVSDILYYDFPDALIGNTIIQIYNMMGVLNINQTASEGSLQVSALKPGVYFIVVSSNDGSNRQTAKFIKE